MFALNHETRIVDYAPSGPRQCGDCRLCCTLMPMNSAEEAKAESCRESAAEKGFAFPPMIPVPDKAAGKPCPHECTGGCAVYDLRPFGCRFWGCAWLDDPHAESLPRPDIGHYVVDLSIDHVVHVDGETGARTGVGTIQVWVDPAFPDAHRDPS